MSSHEVNYLRQYNSSVMEFRSEFSHELDITASITNLPKRSPCSCAGGKRLWGYTDGAGKYRFPEGSEIYCPQSRHWAPHCAGIFGGLEDTRLLVTLR